MTSVNNSQISTKDNLMTSSAIGLLSGVGFAICGYKSLPYIKDGRISDEFVRSVENQLAVKNFDGNIPAKAFEEFNNLIKQIGKAESCSQIADIHFEYFRKFSPDKSFQGIKDFIKQSIKFDMSLHSGIKNENMMNVMLDYLSDIMKANNINELKRSSSNYYENLMQYFDSFEQMQRTIKYGLEQNKNFLLGLDPGVSVRDMTETLFDVKSQKFVKDTTGSISDEFFKVVEKTAGKMQWKTAGIWGATAAAIIGGAMFLIQKFSAPKRSNRSRVPVYQTQPQASTTETQTTPKILTKDSSAAQYQPQPLIKKAPVLAESNMNSQPLIQAHSKTESNLTPQPLIKQQTDRLSHFNNLLNRYNQAKA